MGDVLVLDGKIAAIGEVRAPEGVAVIDGAGKHVAPGVVDCHSHMAIERGINEGSVAISAEVTMKDVVQADDVGIFRALAGGVTTIRLLHGSANPIGGRDEILKLRWHETADALRFPDAPQGIKFALGENPKRSTSRFPDTRMGVEAVYYRAFERAREYRAEWAEFDAARARGEDPAPPRRDLRLDVLVGILEGGRPGPLALLPRGRDPDADPRLPALRVPDRQPAARARGLQGGFRDGRGRCARLGRSATGGPTRSRPTTRFRTTPR